MIGAGTRGIGLKGVRFGEFGDLRFEQLVRHFVELIGLATTSFQLLDVLSQCIGAPEHCVGHFGRENAARADQVLQQVFHQVGQLGRSVQSDGSGRTLDPVRRNQKRVECRSVAAPFQGQECLGQLVQRELGFVDENRQILRLRVGFVFEALEIVNDRLVARFGWGRFIFSGRGRIFRPRFRLRCRRCGLFHQVGQSLLGIFLRGLLAGDPSGFEHLRDALDDRFGIHRLGLGILQQVDMADEPIDGLEHQFHNIAADDQFVFACGIEDVFDLVGQRVDVGQPEHPREAFEAVSRAEHIVHQLVVTPLGVRFVEAPHPFVELEEVFVEPIEQLARFVEKISQQTVEKFVPWYDIRVAHSKLQLFHGLRNSQG